MLPRLHEIRKKRVQLGITQQKLAKELRVAQSTIAKIEKGSINPSYQLAERIFAYLDSSSSARLGTAGDVATRPVVCVSDSDRVGKAVKIMQKHGFKQLPVTDGSACIGSISEGNVSRRTLEKRNPGAVLSMLVTQVMGEAFPMVPEDTPVAGIVGLLQNNQAVLTVKRGQVTGIVTNADLLKLITELA